MAKLKNDYRCRYYVLSRDSVMIRFTLFLIIFHRHIQINVQINIDINDRLYYFFIDKVPIKFRYIFLQQFNMRKTKTMVLQNRRIKVSKGALVKQRLLSTRLMTCSCSKCSWHISKGPHIVPLSVCLPLCLPSRTAITTTALSARPHYGLFMNAILDHLPPCCVS